MSDNDRRPVIVSGTPFAGSSIIGEALAASGVFLGDDFPLPAPNDFSGLACDRAIARLNDHLLEAAGTQWDECLSDEPIGVSGADRVTCDELLKRKFRLHERWGWADPRTVLLLDHWHSLIPDALWIFVVRPPEASVWAMRGRPVMTSVERPREELDEVRARLWAAYARRIAAFARRHPERSLLIDSPSDLYPPRRTALAARLVEATGVAVAESTIAEIFDWMLMRVEAPAAAYELARQDDVESARGELAGVGARLAMEPRPPRVVALAGDEAPPRVCLASFTRCVYSETFVRAQLNRLPAEMFHLWGATGMFKSTQDGIPIWDGDLTDVELLAKAGNRDLAKTFQSSLVRYLQEQNTDAVLAQFGPMSAEYAEPCAELGIPLIAHFHGFDAYRKDLVTGYDKAYRQLFEIAAAIVVVSTDMARQLESLGAPREKIHLIPCGVDVDRFDGADPENAPPTFLAVGRFVPKKGPQLTLLAFSQVLKSQPQARLVMIGEGPLKSPCVHLAKAMGIDGSVSFLGARSHSEVVRWMRQARAFVQHSIRPENGDSEGTPVAVMEAGAMGLPVIASAHTGIADVVVDGVTGFLVEEADADTMAERMIRLVEDPELAARLGAQAQVRVRAEYSLDLSIDRLWRVIRDAIQGGGTQ